MRRAFEIIMALAIPGSYYYISSLLHTSLPLRIAVTAASLIMIMLYLWQRQKGKSLRIPLGKSLAIDLCGALVPIFLAFTSALSIPRVSATLLIPLSISIAMITSLNTMSGVFLNVVRFTLALICLSVPVVPPRVALAWLPLATVIGIMLGSDIFPYVLILKNQHGRQNVFVVGGAGLCDAIAVSYVVSVSIISLLYVFTLSFPTILSK